MSESEKLAKTLNSGVKLGKKIALSILVMVVLFSLMSILVESLPTVTMESLLTVEESHRKLIGWFIALILLGVPVISIWLAHIIIEYREAEESEDKKAVINSSIKFGKICVLVICYFALIAFLYRLVFPNGFTTLIWMGAGVISIWLADITFHFIFGDDKAEESEDKEDNEDNEDNEATNEENK